MAVVRGGLGDPSLAFRVLIRVGRGAVGDGEVGLSAEKPPNCRPVPEFAVKPVRRVNVDLTQGMLRQLDERAARLNISRQAVIKTLLARGLREG